jgi:CubicO group peptidase (beta-lactamase class C family)
MVSFFKWLLLTISLMFVWLAVNVASTTGGWFTSSVVAAKDYNAFENYIKKSIKDESKGNAVMLLIEEGKVISEYGISKGNPVNGDTVFGVASLSKWVTAIGVMVLVEQGKLDLDKPVSSYLTRWALPKSDFNNDEVTIRRLLSHTAGIADSLGHNGFATREDIQPLTEHLTQAKDADEGVDGRVHVGMKPGNKWSYSGGSYNLLQLIIEEVTHMPFGHYMSEAVFNPLGMNSTTYRQEDVKQLAQYFVDENNTRPYPFYTSLAATGLYSSANDLAILVSMQLPENLKNSESNNLLSKESLKEMRMPHASTMGIDIWGLGTMLFTSNNDNDFIIGHGGLSPSLNSTVRLNPQNGNAFILLETGNRFLAADSATKWTLWETGNPDMYMLKNMIPAMLNRVLIGCALILIASLIIVWRKKKQN